MTIQNEVIIENMDKYTEAIKPIFNWFDKNKQFFEDQSSTFQISRGNKLLIKKEFETVISSLKQAKGSISAIKALCKEQDITKT